MNILLIGSGAREHAVARAIDNSEHNSNLYCIASNMNPGIAELCSEIIIDNINDPKLIVEYAKHSKASLAIIGPENPLSVGVSDALWDAKIKVVGPKRSLAQIETSKAFTRELLKEYKLTGGQKYQTFDSMNGVPEFLNELGEAYVVKYDGRAGGKGGKVAGVHGSREWVTNQDACECQRASRVSLCPRFIQYIHTYVHVPGALTIAKLLVMRLTKVSSLLVVY